MFCIIHEILARAGLAERTTGNLGDETGRGVGNAEDPLAAVSLLSNFQDSVSAEGAATSQTAAS